MYKITKENPYFRINTILKSNEDTTLFWYENGEQVPKELVKILDENTTELGIIRIDKELRKL